MKFSEMCQDGVPGQHQWLRFSQFQRHINAQIYTASPYRMQSKNFNDFITMFSMLCNNLLWWFQHIAESRRRDLKSFRVSHAVECLFTKSDIGWEYPEVLDFICVSEFHMILWIAMCCDGLVFISKARRKLFWTHRSFVYPSLRMLSRLLLWFISENGIINKRLMMSRNTNDRGIHLLTSKS